MPLTVFPRRALGVALATLLLLTGRPAAAESDQAESWFGVRERIIIRPVGRISLDYESNVNRATTGGTADVVGKVSAGATTFFTTSTNLQIVLQYQAQLWRYVAAAPNNALINVGTVLTSYPVGLPLFRGRSSISPYVAAQYIGKVTMAPGGSNRSDWNLLAGANFSGEIGQEDILIGGYQFDTLLAEVELTRYTAHALNAAYYHAFGTTALAGLSYRIQRRAPFDSRVDTLWRHTLGGSVQVFPWSWLGLELNASYNYDAASTAANSLGYVTVGGSVSSNLRFDWAEPGI